MYDRDTRLTQILRIGRDVSRRGEGISLLDAMKRARYVGYRPTFRAEDLVPIISSDPSLAEDWLSYSEDKRTLGSKERRDRANVTVGFGHQVRDN
jgi:hypothetical protein